MVKRRWNSIDALKDDSGGWLNDKEAIGNHMVHHFQNMFFKSNNQFPCGLCGLIPEIITVDDNAMLCRIP